MGKARELAGGNTAHEALMRMCSEPTGRGTSTRTAAGSVKDKTVAVPLSDLELTRINKPAEKAAPEPVASTPTGLEYPDTSRNSCVSCGSLLPQFADVLIPERRLGCDERPHHLDAFGTVEDHNFDAT